MENNETDIEILQSKAELGSHDSRFKLVECIGGGATAVVWKALDLNEESVIGQTVYKALKVLHPRLQDPEHIHLLKTEAIHASRLSHMHIVNVIRFTQGSDGYAFIVMEYLQGDSLQYVLKQQSKFTPKQMLAYLSPVAEALDYAHEQGIFHRDLKPANLFVCKNKQSKPIIKILDFGLAWQLRQSSSQLDIEQVKPSGTVEYMAPETFFSHRPQANQDIHAFACVIYEMLQGSPPFGIDIAMRRKPSDIPPKPESLNDKAWKILKRGFAYTPEDRPQTATDLLTAIQQAQFPSSKKQGNSLLWLALIASSVLLVTLASFYWQKNDPAPVPSDTTAQMQVQLQQLQATLDKQLKEKTQQFEAEQQKKQEEISRLQQQLKDKEEETKPKRAFEPKMIPIKAGSFSMGCISDDKSCYDDEKPVHTVKIKAFSLAQTEVTFDQWQACVDGGGCQSNPKPDDRGWGKGKHPVIYISWDDTQEYIQWLNKKTGKNYRLPTEAEWEYAARAGSKTKYSWGNKAPVCDKQANNGAKFDDNKSCDDTGTEKVASYQKNAFGLYDMHGNVWEWVQDRWHSNYIDNPPVDGTSWESGDSPRRVIRGGSWINSPWNLRSAFRFRDTPVSRNGNLGFRLATGQD